MPIINCQSDVFDLGSQSEKYENNAFFFNKSIDDSLDNYIDQFMDNFLSHLDLLLSDILMGDNLGDEHNQIDFKVLSKRQ